MHLHYHGDRDRVLAGWVRPAAASLFENGLARRFFFIRYLLGGPHVRLRVEVADADAPAARELMHNLATTFMARQPSPAAMPPERIHRFNPGIISSDPFANDSDDIVIADNTVHDYPVYFEVERYGGPGLYEHSVDFFGVSSIETLTVLMKHANEPAGLRTAGHMRLLLQQAWGHAAGPEEFLRLADYGSEMFGRPLARVLPLADTAFERGRESICALVQTELTSLAGQHNAPSIAEAARGLRTELRELTHKLRYEVGVSHMHMTANRLGMMNPDEVYLSRILVRAVGAVAAERPHFWRGIWDAHRWWVETRTPCLRAEYLAAVSRFTTEQPLFAASTVRPVNVSAFGETPIRPKRAKTNG